MLETFLRTDNLNLDILNFLAIFEIITLTATNKNISKIILESDVWEIKLLKFSRKRSRKKFNEIIEFQIDSNKDYSKYCIALYRTHSYISNKMPFRLTIDNLHCVANSKLIFLQFSDFYILQSIRDADWQYLFDENNLKVNSEGMSYIDLDLTLRLNNIALINCATVLRFDIENESRNFEARNELYEFKVDSMDINFHLYKNSKSPGKRKIQFPYIQIPCATLHELIFEENMKNKMIEFVYIV